MICLNVNPRGLTPFIFGLTLAVASAEDPFTKAPEGNRTPMSVLEILDVKEGWGLHTDLAFESQRIREIERRCLVALRDGTLFQKRTAIEIIRLYHLKSLAPTLMELINLKADMIYTSGNPADPVESAENVYPCFSVLKKWIGSDLTLDLRENLEKLGTNDDPETEQKRKLLKLLMDLEAQH